MKTTFYFVFSAMAIILSVAEPRIDHQLNKNLVGLISLSVLNILLNSFLFFSLFKDVSNELKTFENQNEASRRNIERSRVKRDIRFSNCQGDSCVCEGGGCVYNFGGGGSHCAGGKCHCRGGGCTFHLSSSSSNHCSHGSCHCYGGGCIYHTKSSDCQPSSCLCYGGGCSYHS